MFHWLTGGTSGEAGLERMRTEFCEMVDAGRHAFTLATQALLGEFSLQSVQNDLFIPSRSERRHSFLTHS